MNCFRFLSVLMCSVFISNTQLQSQNPVDTVEREALTIGDRLTIESEVLQENRGLNIYLPLSYSADSTRKYPVIYLLDGSLDEDFIHVSGLVQFGSFSWINMLPESIVVGITNVDRRRDFTFPTTIEKDKKDFPTTGGSSKFIEFFSKEVLPFVEAQYRTNDSKTIIGQSLGGLLTTEIVFKRPELFDNYIIVSPSLWWDNQSLLRLDTQALKAPKQVFVAVGKEGEVMERDALQLYKKLQELNDPNLTVYYKFLEEQDHGDALHLAVYAAFEKLFKNDKN